MGLRSPILSYHASASASTNLTLLILRRRKFRMVAKEEYASQEEAPDFLHFRHDAPSHDHKAVQVTRNSSFAVIKLIGMPIAILLTGTIQRQITKSLRCHLMILLLVHSKCTRRALTTPEMWFLHIQRTTNDYDAAYGSYFEYCSHSKRRRAESWCPSQKQHQLVTEEDSSKHDNFSQSREHGNYSFVDCNFPWSF